MARPAGQSKDLNDDVSGDETPWALWFWGFHCRDKPVGEMGEILIMAFFLNTEREILFFSFAVNGSVCQIVL